MSLYNCRKQVDERMSYQYQFQRIFNLKEKEKEEIQELYKSSVSKV